MNVTLYLDGTPELLPIMRFEKHVIEAGPAGSFFKVVQLAEEESTQAGLVVRVGGVRTHTWVPAARILKAEVVE